MIPNWQIKSPEIINTQRQFVNFLFIEIFLSKSNKKIIANANAKKFNLLPAANAKAKIPISKNF